MNKIKLITTFAFLLLSLQVFAEDAQYQMHADSLLNQFNLNLGSNQQIIINGNEAQSNRPCSITVYNITKMDPAHLEVSKMTQMIEVDLKTNNNILKFIFSRFSEVTNFSNSADFKISQKTYFTAASGLSVQSLEIVNNSISITIN
ncbi:MAG: hypothetical protein Q7U04_15695, partial [Bacteriovorax sp.]|nr:hypothetical protein [Bacteriovorax sp.]